MMGSGQARADRSKSVGGARNATGNDVTAGNSVPSTSRSLSDNRAQAVITRNRFDRSKHRGDNLPWNVKKW